MPCDLKQNGDGSTGMQGIGGGDGQMVTLYFQYTASSVDQTMFTASRAYIVKSVILRPDVAGTDAGAVTVAVKQAASGTAIASGTALHSGTGNLKGTISTKQVLTLQTTESDIFIAAGSLIYVYLTGVLTAAVGCVSVELCPA